MRKRSSRDRRSSAKSNGHGMTFQHVRPCFPLSVGGDRQESQLLPDRSATTCESTPATPPNAPRCRSRTLRRASPHQPELSPLQRGAGVGPTDPGGTLHHHQRASASQCSSHRLLAASSPAAPLPPDGRVGDPAMHLGWWTDGPIMDQLSDGRHHRRGRRWGLGAGDQLDAEVVLSPPRPCSTHPTGP